MSFLLASFLGGPTNNSDSDSSDENKQLIIEKMTAKMVNSVHLEDRKAAAQTIKSLARSHRLEIGTLALEALFEELRRDLEDEELAKIILETLDIVTAKSDGNSGGEFCEILLKNEANVGLLLELMGDSDDFYLKFTSIQILISLCASQPFQLQTTLLQSPSGVSKVMDLLKDPREIIRNEGLLLGVGLVEGNNRDLQKVLVFQGAFEEVFRIIVEEEGPWTGPVIIQDAFNLVSGMLNLNTSNQTYFRDSVCFKQLAGLLAVPESADEDDNLWNRTRIVNYLAALKVLDGFLCKENVDLEASQNAVLRTNFIKPLLHLAFNPQIPLQVSASSLNCLTGLIWSNPRSQQGFAKEKLNFSPLSSNIKIELPISSLMGAVLVALHGNAIQEGGFEQRIKALEVVEAFCAGNPEGQLILISTLKGGDNEAISAPGTAIIESLFDLDSSRKRDPWHCWFPSILLAHLIDGNEAAKQVLSKHAIEEEEVLTVLMLSLVKIGNDSRGSTCQKSIIGYLQLLVIWFHDSPASINSFLQEGPFVQYLLERITHQSSSLETEIQGLCALILGCCVLYNDESVEEFGAEALKGIIKNRIGPDLFVSRLSRLRSLGDKNECLNYKITAILLKNYDNLLKLVVRPTPIGSKASQTATLAQLTSDLHETRTLLASTRADLSETTALSDKLKIGIKERDEYITRIQKIVGEKNQKIAQMAQELSTNNSNVSQQQDRLSQCQEDQDTLQNLTETIKSFKETVARQQARIEELEAALNGNVGEELEKWKEAYHRLYEQVKEQLNFEGASTNSPNEDDIKETKHNTDITGISENADIAVKAPCLRIDTEHLSGTSDNNEDNSHVTVTSDSVEILSPSMFMSPLIESTSTISEQVISTPELITSTSELSELVTFNQMPVVDKANEYPELVEQRDTSITAALIVSEEFALNDPNPSTDEIVQSISSECPPYNFLSSEADDEAISVAVASKEEIDNVLGFFDNLPAVDGSVASIQEGLDHLHFSEGTGDTEVVENNKTEVADIVNEESYKDDHEEHYEVVDEPYVFEQVDYIVDQSNQVQDYSYQYDNTNTDQHSSEYSQDYNAETMEYSQEAVGDSVTTDDYTHDYTAQEDYSESTTQKIATQDYSIQEYPAGSTSDFAYEENIALEYTGEGDQVQFVQDQELHAQEPEESQDHQITLNQEQDQAEAYEQVPQVYYETQVVAEEPIYDCNGYEQGGYEKPQEPVQEYTEQYNEHYQEEFVQTENTEHYSTEQFQEEKAQEYTSTEEQTQVEYNEQQYLLEHNAEYPTEHSAEYHLEYPVEYATEYPQEYHQENVVDFTQAIPEEYNSDQTVSKYPVDYSAEYAIVTDYSQAASQEYPSENTHVTHQEYNSEYTADDASKYPQEIVAEYAQETSQEDALYTAAEYFTEYAQEPVQESPQETQPEALQETPQEEYYYYDESTGYTYGFDQNVNQYYYYDPNTGEYIYYTADTQPQQDEQQVEDANYALNDGSVASSNPSLFDSTGPPIISLQQQQHHEGHSALAANNFVADQIYNI